MNYEGAHGQTEIAAVFEVSSAIVSQVVRASGAGVMDVNDQKRKT
jgi:hypothetical protein